MKICIIGISGAGKTRLAQKLLEEFSLPAYGYDEIYWDKPQTEYVKKTLGTMKSLISEIKCKDSRIMEGSYDKCLVPFFAANPIFAEKVKIVHDTQSYFREITNHATSHNH
ncbi:hypothetical protein [Providencia alcalifaciens]|uniref:hypothetical protein n=1 Tax=Providencia alcalifaciens TaxID=126385 RepID=UPI00055FA735|nr:hypothetical protein [Providencia alcalifaciens]